MFGRLFLEHYHVDHVPHRLLGKPTVGVVAGVQATS